MGIKSRLSVKEMDGYHKYILDKYFESILAEETKKRREESIPEYERLYEAPKVAISVEGADEIERASWKNTERLIVEEDEPTVTVDVISPVIEMPEIIPVVAESESFEQNADGALSAPELEFLASVMNGSVAQSAEGDLAAERINELAMELIGDVFIELADDTYSFIEDYRTDAERLIQNK